MPAAYKPKSLSKTRFMIGLQCPVWLWKAFNDPDSLPVVDAATQAKFDVGHEVGELAQRLFPEGVVLDPSDYFKHLDDTKTAVQQRKTVFEGGFAVEKLYARPDILVPVEEDEWDVYEVKSSTEVKDQYLYDLAFQKHVYEKAGLKIRNCHVIHLNNEYVKQGPINPYELLSISDETQAVESLFEEIPGLIAEMWRIKALPVCPEPVLVGQCEPYYGCPVHDPLYEALPEGNVFELYYAKAKAAEFYNEGIHELSQLPPDARISAKNQVQVAAARTGKTHVEPERIKEWLSRLQYPLYYLDFETERFAIPRHDGTRPYEQVPVQYSLHIEREDGRVEHHEYLHDEPTDARPIIAEQLKTLLGQQGSIIAYNQGFEIRILQSLATLIPEHEPWITPAINRFADLREPFKNYHYYSPKQRGSCSLKDTMPALLGKNHYACLAINDGETAQIEYMRITYTDVPEEEKQKVKKDLLKYCQLDTEGMVWMVERLRELFS